ncbi:hypothetical protein F5B21DRAFT_525214 [Xylaria acuta]|nr:hypothetical protein F5B21DRAFT_525214 [Xylaria acuta]
MSSANNLGSGVASAALIQHISAQLDGTTGIVKIPTDLFTLLDIEGQTAATSHASSILGYPVEFYLDSTDLSRVYLADLASIKVVRPCEARRIPGFSLPVLVPAMSQPAGPTNHPSGVDMQQPNHTQPPEAPLPPPSAPRVQKKKAVRRPDGFTAFKSHQFPFVKQENRGLKRTEICSILNTKWAVMTEEERRPIFRLAGAHYTRRPLDRNQTPGPGDGPASGPPVQLPAHRGPGGSGQGQDANEQPAQDRQNGNPSREAQKLMRGEIDWGEYTHYIFG